MITRLLPAFLLALTFVAAATSGAGEIRWFHWLLAAGYVAGLAWWSLRSWREGGSGA